MVTQRPPLSSGELHDHHDSNSALASAATVEDEFSMTTPTSLTWANDSQSMFALPMYTEFESNTQSFMCMMPPEYQSLAFQ